MCGRTVCSLAPGDIQKACRFRDRKGRQLQPDWKDAPGGKQFFPSYNTAPGCHTPVLLSNCHVNDGRETTPRVIQPMYWGLIPSWHKGKQSEKVFETNNCRAESMLDKQTYKVPLQKGRRCVILVEGFYEWKRTKDKKQPYYIYFPQPSNKHGDLVKVEQGQDVIVKVEQGQDGKVKVEQGQDGKVKVEQGQDGKVKADTAKQEVKDEYEQKQDDVGCPGTPMIKTELMEKAQTSVAGGCADDGATREDSTGVEDAEAELPRLLTIAGVFDVWNPPDGSEPLYSYSVITVDSSPAMSWIHHRMPAILTTDEEVADWLDVENVPLNKAVKLIRPVTCLESHPVSTVVNNSRNKTPDCVKPIDLSKQHKPVNSLMSAWLSKGSTSSPQKSSTSPHKAGMLTKSKSAAKPSPMMAWLSRGQKRDNTDSSEPVDKKRKT